MIVRSMYIDRREVLKVYRAGKIIWPEPAKAELSVMADLFSEGYHVLQLGFTAVLSSRGVSLTPADISPAVLQSVSFDEVFPSRTRPGAVMLPAEGILCVCDMENMTRGERQALIANAISFRHHAHLAAKDTASSSVAAAVYADRTESNGTASDVNGLDAAAVFENDREDFVSKPDMTAEIPAAAFGSFSIEDNSGSDISTEIPAALYTASRWDSKSADTVTVLPFRLEGIVPMDGTAYSRTENSADAELSETLPMASMLRLMTTCKAHMAVASTPDLDTCGDSRTAARCILRLEGEKPEESWYDPVQTESNLYIRSVASSWQDAEKLSIDLSVFYEPKQTGNDLYLRSVDSLWTDGGSANIDTAFFLEPVQEGSNLYIRQDIFGGE